MSRGILARRRGHTLVEVLFGAFLVSLCATVLAATMPVANESRQLSRNRNVALSLAQKQMEALRSIGYANLTPDRMLAYGLIDSNAPVAANTFSFTAVDAGVVDSPSLMLRQGRGTVTVEQAGMELRRVTIDVTWWEGGRVRSLRIGTLVANL